MIVSYKYLGEMTIMCGLCGIINYNEDTVNQTITNMMNAIVHRGPDEDGKKYYTGKNVALAHKTNKTRIA